MDPSIRIRNARLHNLKNVSLEIPKNRLVVLYRAVRLGQIHPGLRPAAQGRRSASTWNRSGWSPGAVQAAGRFDQRAVALDQRRPAPDQPQPALDRGHRHRGIHLPARAVRPPGSPPLPALRPGRAAAHLRILRRRLAGRIRRKPRRDAYPCPHCGGAVPEMGMANFSFNKPAGACPTCTGWAWCARRSSAG